MKTEDLIIGNCYCVRDSKDVYVYTGTRDCSYGFSFYFKVLDHPHLSHGFHQSSIETEVTEHPYMNSPLWRAMYG